MHLAGPRRRPGRAREGDNAQAMVNRGSAPDSLHWVLALPAVVVGLLAMTLAAALTAWMGLRPMLIASELALASPALLALALAPGRAALALRPVPARVLATSLGCGAALWAASLGLLELQYAVWSPPPGYLQEFQRLHDMLRPRGPADAVLSVLAIAVAPAVCEELLFRGLVLQSLLPPLRTAGAVAASAVLFGLIHLDFSGSGPTLYRVPFAIVVGVGFALLCLRSGSLIPAMLAHAVVNTTTFAAALQEEVGTALPSPRPLLGAALLLFGIMAFAWLVSVLRPARPSPSPGPAHSL
jgi:sodium transport system permease protein